VPLYKIRHRTILKIILVNLCRWDGSNWFDAVTQPPRTSLSSMQGNWQHERFCCRSNINLRSQKTTGLLDRYLLIKNVDL
jgi:hypothetical protein